jgi:hypothetical protein
MNRKIHSNEAGYVAERKNPFAAGKVTIYVATQQGIDVAPDKYAVVCDAHATIVGVSSIPKARQFMKCPEFCEECMEIAKHRTE